MNNSTTYPTSSAEMNDNNTNTTHHTTRKHHHVGKDASARTTDQNLVNDPKHQADAGNQAQPKVGVGAKVKAATKVLHGTAEAVRGTTMQAIDSLTHTHNPHNAEIADRGRLETDQALATLGLRKQPSATEFNRGAPLGQPPTMANAQHGGVPISNTTGATTGYAENQTGTGFQHTGTGQAQGTGAQFAAATDPRQFGTAQQHDGYGGNQVGTGLHHMPQPDHADGGNERDIGQAVGTQIAAGTDPRQFGATHPQGGVHPSALAGAAATGAMVDQNVHPLELGQQRGQETHPGQPRLPGGVQQPMGNAPNTGASQPFSHHHREDAKGRTDSILGEENSSWGPKTSNNANATAGTTYASQDHPATGDFSGDHSTAGNAPKMDNSGKMQVNNAPMLDNSGAMRTNDAPKFNNSSAIREAQQAMKANNQGGAMGNNTGAGQPLTNEGNNAGGTVGGVGGVGNQSGTTGYQAPGTQGGAPFTIL